MQNFTIPMVCPTCGEPHDNVTGIIAWCAACGHRWLAAVPAGGSAVEYNRDHYFETYATGFVRELLCAHRPPPGRLLDAGCGNGDFLRIAQQFGYEVEGIDLSHEAAKLCRQRGFNARQADLLNVDLRGPFDVITLWDVAEHLQDPHTVLSRLAGSLANGGILIAKVPTYGPLSPMLSSRAPRLAGALLGAPEHVQYFTPDSLHKLIGRLGLRAERLPLRHIRSRASGGSIKRRLGRLGARLIKAVSGDANMLVIASRAS